MTYDWQARWQKNDIGFHLHEVNPLLQQYWPSLNLNGKGNVLVPLCGKTLDMIWLAQQGHHVIGAELSDLACIAFFTENHLAFKTEKIQNFTRYYNEKIEIFCGDFFALNQALLPKIDAVYDRAALVALPQDMRPNYVKHVKELLANEGQILLVIYESPHEIKGPPYAITSTEIKSLFLHFKQQELARIQKTDIPQHWYTKGYQEDDTFEIVYALKNIKKSPD